MNINVCAVIVTYNFDDSFFNCIKSIKPQVKEVIVVDNNSNEKCKEILYKLNKSSDIHIIFNDENLGIAGALNKGIKYALEKGYEWIVTLDDDSQATEDMIIKMIHEYVIVSDSNIGILTPNIFDVNIQEFTYDNNILHEYINKCIQSGCMIKAEVFNKVGLFNEDLFIYYVDDEFCERIINNELKILRVNNAVLNHRDGIYEKKKFLFKEFNYNNRSNLTVYYRTRNNIYMAINYNKSYIYENIKDFVKILLYSNKKISNLNSFFRGLKDSINRNYGICEDIHNK